MNDMSHRVLRSVLLILLKLCVFPISLVPIFYYFMKGIVQKRWPCSGNLTGIPSILDADFHRPEPLALHR